LIDPKVPASVEYDNAADVPKAYRQYAERLNAHLRTAWNTALEATLAAQEDNAFNTASKTNTDIESWGPCVPPYSGALKQAAVFLFWTVSGARGTF
jgi:hypothetical protein